MGLSYPDASDIESTCDNPVPSDLPLSLSPTCNAEAVTWVNRTDGTRLYLCESHILDLLRFPADEDRLADMGLSDLRELARDRGVNAPEAGRAELLDRIAKRKDAEEVLFEGGKPRAKVCPKCLCVTLVEEFDRLDSLCRGCLDDREVLSTDSYR